MATHVDSEIAVEQDLEIIILLARISYYQTRLQVLTAQRHRIRESEWVIPLGISNLAIREAEI